MRCLSSLAAAVDQAALPHDRRCRMQHRVNLLAGQVQKVTTFLEREQARTHFHDARASKRSREFNVIPVDVLLLRTPVILPSGRPANRLAAPESTDRKLPVLLSKAEHCLMETTELSPIIVPSLPIY